MSKGQDQAGSKLTGGMLKMIAMTFVEHASMECVRA